MERLGCACAGAAAVANRGAGAAGCWLARPAPTPPSTALPTYPTDGLHTGTQQLLQQLVAGSRRTHINEPDLPVLEPEGYKGEGCAAIESLCSDYLLQTLAFTTLRLNWMLDQPSQSPEREV